MINGHIQTSWRSEPQSVFGGDSVYPKTILNCEDHFGAPSKAENFLWLEAGDTSWARWSTLEAGLGMLRQEDFELGTILDCIEDYFNKQNQTQEKEVEEEKGRRRRKGRNQQALYVPSLTLRWVSLKSML